MVSDDNFSDLTDLESDNNYTESKSKKKPTGKSAGKSSYRIKNALKVPRATTYTAQALYGMEIQPQNFFFELGLICFFAEQIHSCDINLEPEYQRGLKSNARLRFSFKSVVLILLPSLLFIIIIDVVWPEAKQIGIIDSVFRNFYIPPVIFAVNTFEDGSETKTCIDGKQRLTSIHK